MRIATVSRLVLSLFIDGVEISRSTGRVSVGRGATPKENKKKMWAGYRWIQMAVVSRCWIKNDNQGPRKINKRLPGVGRRNTLAYQYVLDTRKTSLPMISHLYYIRTTMK